MKKRIPYIILLILLIAVEIVIALTQRDNWLRYYGGDVIVVWAVYCLVQSVIGGKKPVITHIGVLLFAFLVEFLQYIHIVDIIGLGDIEFFRILIGTSFAVEDLFSYALGTIIGLTGSLLYNKMKKSLINTKVNE
ncbi:MAG: DUF2809 domain-containing protein [Ruminococcus sp.]|nr:DUF2809 domain-containing protein [Ruminococcus sp.]